MADDADDTDLFGEDDSSVNTDTGQHDVGNIDEEDEDKLGDDLFGDESDTNAGPSQSVQDQPPYEDDDDNIYGRHDDDDDADAGQYAYNDAAQPTEYAEEAEPERIEERTLRRYDGPDPDNPKTFLVRLPPFLSIESRPYDRSTYEDAVSDPKPSPNEKATREQLLLKVENTVRWRQDPHRKTKESNARLVRWSDNSFSLLLGEELFAVSISDLSAMRQRQYLVIQHPDQQILQNRLRFTQSLAFRPHDTSSKTHNKLARVIATKHQRVAKSKFMPTTVDPERVKAQIEKAEMEKLRARRRLENRRQATEEREVGLGRSSRRTYGDEYDDMAEDAGSGYRRGYQDDYYDDGDDDGGRGGDDRRYGSRDRDLLERIESRRYDRYEDEDDSGFVVADDEVEEVEDDEEEEDYEEERRREKRLQEMKKPREADEQQSSSAGRKKQRMTIEESDEDE